MASVTETPQPEEGAELCQHTDTTDRVVFNSKGGVKKVTICNECGIVVNNNPEG